jgi:hypothetical protein
MKMMHSRLGVPRSIYSFAPLVALLLLSVPAFGQDRVRRIATFQSGAKHIAVSARNGSVAITASEYADVVLAGGSAAETRVWIDSVRVIMRRPVRTESGEEVTFEIPFPGVGDRVSVNRIVTGAGTRYRLDFWDRHVVNHVAIPVTSTRLQAFITAVLEAARAADRMRGIEPVLDMDSAATPPALTPESRQLIQDSVKHLTASAILEVVVNADGTPDTLGAEIVSEHVMADYYFRNLIPRLRFVPATRRGQPVRVRARIPVFVYRYPS